MSILPSEPSEALIGSDQCVICCWMHWVSNASSRYIYSRFPSVPQHSPGPAHLPPSTSRLGSHWSVCLCSDRSPQLALGVHIHGLERGGLNTRYWCRKKGRLKKMYNFKNNVKILLQTTFILLGRWCYSCHVIVVFVFSFVVLIQLTEVRPDIALR